MKKIAIVDLRRPVHADFLGRLKDERWDQVFAFSPLAAWRLEEAGIPFQNGDGIVEPKWFGKEGLLNFTRLESAFTEAFGAEKDSWLGLFYQFKFIVDYAFIEERRLEFLEDAEATVFSDIDHESRESVLLEDHLCNRAALYFWAVPPERCVQLPRKPETFSRLSVQLKRLTWPGVRKKLEKTLGKLDVLGQKPALVTRYDYDWEKYRPELQSRFVALSPEWLVQKATVGFSAAEEDFAEALSSFAAALERHFSALLPRAFPHLSRILLAKARGYAKVRAALSRNLPKLCERHDIRAALSSFCGSGEEFLVNYYLKASGRPTLFYQHGGYQSRVRAIRTSEALPASHNFVFGRADAEFFEGFRLGGEIHPVGSALLDAMTLDRERPGHFLYVLFPNTGNANYISGELAYPETNQAALFAQHRRVIELFARHPEATLHVREAPAQTGWYLYEPLREFVRKRAFKNILFDRSRASADRFLSGYEGIILDYPCTTLLQALAKNKKIACFTGGGCRLTPEGLSVLKRAAACGDTETDFLAALEEWLRGRRPRTDERARREYLSLYGGGGEPSAPKVRPLLEKLLGLMAADGGASR